MLIYLDSAILLLRKDIWICVCAQKQSKQRRDTDWWLPEGKRLGRMDEIGEGGQEIVTK